GLNAMKPIAQAEAKIAIDSARCRPRSDCRVVSAHRIMTGVMTSAPARSPSHQVSQMEPKFDHSAKPARARLSTPTVALISVGIKLRIANRATPAGLANVPRPSDQ